MSCHKVNSVIPLQRIWRIENVLKAEHCFGGDRNGKLDRIEFYGRDDSGKMMRVITKFDEAGNIYADLSEVTVLTGVRKNNLPPLMSLREVVEAAQERDALPTANRSNIPNPPQNGNGLQFLRNGTLPDGTADEISVFENSRTIPVLPVICKENGTALICGGSQKPRQIHRVAGILN